MNVRNGKVSGQSLTGKDYWETSGYAALRLSPDQRSAFQPLFDQHVPKGIGKEALEIGACPGVHLAALARSHGYRPIALDILPRVHMLRKTFADAGFPSVETLETDFLTWKPDRRFAVVMSLGFIEHFEDPGHVIRLHWNLVEEGGFMVLGIPLFGRYQRWLRQRILPPEMLEQVLAVHNLQAMNIPFLSDACRSLPDARILFAGPIWNMNTWFGLREPYISTGGRLILAAWKLVAWIPRRLNWSSPSFSPYALFIVQRGGA